MMEKMDKANTNESSHVPIVVKFIFGGMAGSGGVLVTHPLDLVKNRMQMSGEMGVPRQYRTSFHAVYFTVKNEGVLAVYKGLTASIFRQSTYTSVRLGIFTTGTEYLTERHGKPPTFCAKLILGIIGGAAAACVGTPADLIMVRMTLDGRLPLEHRRNYANIFDAFVKIVREERIAALWRGCGPTMLRAIVANAVQLPTYSQVKRALIDTGHFGDSTLTYFTTSLISSFVTSIFSVPVDIAKTRIQNMAHNTNVPQYKNVVDVWIKIMKHEGLQSLWKGFMPYYIRLAPQAVLMFVILEQLTRLYTKFVLGNEKQRSAF